MKNQIEDQSIDKSFARRSNQRELKTKALLVVFSLGEVGNYIFFSVQYLYVSVSERGQRE